MSGTDRVNGTIKNQRSDRNRNDVFSEKTLHEKSDTQGHSRKIHAWVRIEAKRHWLGTGGRRRCLANWETHRKSFMTWSVGWSTFSEVRDSEKQGKQFRLVTSQMTFRNSCFCDTSLRKCDLLNIICLKQENTYFKIGPQKSDLVENASFKGYDHWTEIRPLKVLKRNLFVREQNGLFKEQVPYSMNSPFMSTRNFKIHPKASIQTWRDSNLGVE